MDEDLHMSLVPPGSPQLVVQPALLRAEQSAIEELQGINNELRNKLERQCKELKNATDKITFLEEEVLELKEANKYFADERQKKLAIIADQNDYIRQMEMDRKLGEIEKRFNKVAGSDSEGYSLDEESDFETRPPKNRKRKVNNSLEKGKGNKTIRKDNEEEMELEIAPTPSTSYDKNFPALGKGKNQSNVKVSESVETGRIRGQVSNATNSRPGQPKIPPVILREKSRYNEVTAGFSAKKIRFLQATTLPEGVKIQPSTVDDFRAMTKYLDEIKAEYHSYQLSEDKLLHVVLRGVLETFTEEEIEADLKAQGFSPKKVIRWKYKDGNSMPMVLVLVPKEDKGIFNITNIKNNSIKVESQKVKARTTQCFNCQMFGHSSFGCRAKPRCVKCGDYHRSAQCTLLDRDNPKCANCAGKHPASFGGCPKHPKHLGTQQKKSPQGNNFRWGAQENAKLAANPENMGAAINSINQMNAAMQQFFKNLQQMQQQFASTFMSFPGMSKA